jgi:ElaB/YqjD/DUF883 family membrane-anchored ribosome-binding protein
MNNDIHPEPTLSHPPEAVGNFSRRAGDLAGEAVDKAGAATDELTDAAKRAADTARVFCHSAAGKAEATLALSKEYVRRNPVPVFLGAIAVGAAMGYMVMMARRKQTFGERYADDPMTAVRDSVLGAFAPVARRVHRGYDSALEGAGKAIHRFGPGNSFSHRIGRIGNHLKFW